MARNLEVVVVGVVMALVAISAGGDVQVVGGDQGWDAASDVASWSIGRSFRVGDNIWFTYSAAREGIAELASKAEYESCDITNPIRMYTGGLDKVELDREGPRYFASSSPEVCLKGLKLHVHVEPQGFKSATDSKEWTRVEAAGPRPSGSVRVGLGSFVIAMALLCVMVFF